MNDAVVGAPDDLRGTGHVTKPIGVAEHEILEIAKDDLVVLGAMHRFGGDDSFHESRHPWWFREVQCVDPLERLGGVDAKQVFISFRGGEDLGVDRWFDARRSDDHQTRHGRRS